RLTLNAPHHEWGCYESMLTTFAQRNELTMEDSVSEGLPLDGCPDVMFKTTPDRSLQLAQRITEQHGIRCVVLCYCGVIHGYLDAVDSDRRAAVVGDVVQQHSRELREMGGDWRSRHLTPMMARPEEQIWTRILAQEFLISLQPRSLPTGDT
ncbi:MAG: hypothetical protein KDA85_18555, partial [Planctomycetaceae bacterium]|nr:hypothetical protein [Planctomycetaceae bacterium]